MTLALLSSKSIKPETRSNNRSIFTSAKISNRNICRLVENNATFIARNSPSV